MKKSDEGVNIPSDGEVLIQNNEVKKWLVYFQR